MAHICLAFRCFLLRVVSIILPKLDFVDACIILGALSSIHLLVCLFTAWPVDFKCFAYYSKVKNIDQDDSCERTSAKFCGSKEIVPLNSRKSVACYFQTKYTSSKSNTYKKNGYFKFALKVFDKMSQRNLDEENVFMNENLIVVVANQNLFSTQQTIPSQMEILIKLESLILMENALILSLLSNE
ncbi:hypothetical protein RYX36_018189 [Vicia faba]